MTIVSDPRNSALARQEIVASAILNARAARRGAPAVTNVLDVIGRIQPTLRDEVLDEADAVLAALRKAGFEV